VITVATPFTVTATLNGISRGATVIVPAPVPIPDPTPLPPLLLNVKDYGVKGDNTTNDVTALNALISKAAPGATIYFPAASYFLGDSLKVFRPDLNFLGDGDASILRVQTSSYHVQLGSGQPFSGFTFRKLQFLGLPGKYMKDGTCKGGILNFGSKGTVFEDCTFSSCSDPVYNAGASYGTVVQNCRVNGWGRVAIFCNGGERVTNCRLIQDDPDLMGERSSHGFYVHGNATDVQIVDTEIANCRKYACQVYSEAAGTTTKGVRLLRLKIRDSANGIIFAHSAPGAGEIVDAMIDSCQISGVYAGSSLSLKDGDGIQILNNVIDGGSTGIQMGVWAPYEPGFSLVNVNVQGNIVKNAGYGIWTLPSAGGTFKNIQINGNHVTGNQQNYNITGPGVVMVPGEEPPGAGVVEGQRPSDDHGEIPS
jgi:hypothetical protein